MNFSRAFSFQLSRQLSRRPLWKDANLVCSWGSGGCCVIINRQLTTNRYSNSVSGQSQLGGGNDNFSLLKVNHNAPSSSHRIFMGEGGVLRNFSSQGEGSTTTTEGEMSLKRTIKKCFPNATNVNVEDISGGCGSMYQIYIEAPEFSGLTTVKQHRLVNEALKQEIKSMHGIRIQTAVPKKT